MHRVIATLATLLLAASCSSSEPVLQRSAPTKDVPLHAVEVELPRVLEGLSGFDVDEAGRSRVIPCRTCHESDAGSLPEDASKVGGPHTGLTVTHGSLRCAACHAPSDRSSLRLADGDLIPLTDAMSLCAQCHGPQKRDYDHGAHGGMRGYWDLTRGPRVRNHCVACHDPHAPKFGSFMPMEGPRDRFSEQSEGTPHD